MSAAAGATAVSLRPAASIASFDGPVGAYVHVPFCERICPFCPHNNVLAEGGLARRYFVALRPEVDWYVPAHGDARHAPFTSLYIGGGTQTLYPDELADVIRMIPVSGERAVEVLPNHGTPQRLDGLAAMRITAVSIGAQSFHDGLLRREVGLAQMSCAIDLDRRALGARSGRSLIDGHARYHLGVRVEPFAVAVSDAVLDDLRERIRRTRWPDSAPGGPWAEGADLDYLRGLLEYWADGFDWRTQEQWLNRFDHRVADVDGVRIHFVHHRADDGRVPLVLTHGSPSTFIELLSLVDRLGDRFDLVVPSLPGYAFSQRPSHSALIHR